ncbi:MAG: AI-2E family transporter [Methylococcales symbiont of Iophon sp. n. MRB-2018]|nr:MAG: AI-2E family transporter [Methylococcales symbiont of Iophon sp. n. MRB-2018]KAF3979914.1 MAG: AI-2E family transporter [Methylococcales symbiont of Iophon sp. n. MRB-2018]
MTAPQKWLCLTFILVTGWLIPLLVGDKIDLHPVAVMFAVLGGDQLFGFLGVLLALLVASITMVMLRHIHDLYQDSDFYSAEN